MSWLLSLNPLIGLAVAVVPLALLAMFWRIYPRWPLVLWLLLPLGLSLVLMWSEYGAMIALACDAAIFGLGLIDVWQLPKRGVFSVQREALRTVSLRKTHPVRLVVESLANRPYAMEIRDEIPPEFQAKPAEFRVILAGRSRATMDYELLASRRGALALEKTYLRVRSPFSLWHRDLEYDCQTPLHIYPDLKQLEEYAILARTNRLSLLGVRRTRKVGQDNEFERLRDFTRDDVYKHIDWRSSARRRKLTVKDFQSNQSQRIVFVIDCGRMMVNSAGGLSLLDHAFNSMLMLSYVALRQGDSVGLLCFSDEIHCYVPPKSGNAQMNRLLHACFDRFPRLVESRYDEAFLYLDSHCRKRSLVVMITNLIDEVNANQVQQYLGASMRRHLGLGVLLRDQQIFSAAEAKPRDDQELYRGAAAADLLLWRAQVLRNLDTLGVRTLDVMPEHLTAPLVNSYLEIKARHLL